LLDTSISIYSYGDLRLERTINGEAAKFYYNGSQLLCEKDNEGKMTKIYTNDNEGKLGMTRYIYDNVGTLKNKQCLYYLFDELGSVNAVTNEVGLPVQYYIYDPYGNITNATNDPVNNLTFVGRYDGWRDWDTGLTQFVHRWYSSDIGRWVSKDPIGIKAGMNVYAYVYNNSLNKNDPLGLCGKQTLKDFIFDRVSYGNFCGKNFTGGQKLLSEEAQNTVDFQSYFNLKSPKNSTDQCCYEHDMCAYLVRMSNYGWSSITECNKNLANCAARAADKSWSPYEKIIDFSIIAYFGNIKPNEGEPIFGE
jgi:RHS repeat-associated protein